MRVVYEFILSRCRPQTVLFRGLPRCFASLVSRGFLCLRWAEKLNLFLSSSVFMGSFSSYELFIIPRLDSVIHNSGFLTPNIHYSFSFKPRPSLFIIQLPHPILGPLAHVTPSVFFIRILRSEALVYNSFFSQNSHSTEIIRH